MSKKNKRRALACIIATIAATLVHMSTDVLKVNDLWGFVIGIPLTFAILATVEFKK